MTDVLTSLIESLEADHGSDQLQQLYDRVDESGLTQTELAEMAEEAKQEGTISVLESINRGETKC